MLVLTRRQHQRIRIGDDVWIDVVMIGTDRGQPAVKLGITAPPDVAVMREELLDRDDARRDRERRDDL